MAIETDCWDSPSAVYVEETWSTYLCNITVDEVYDTNTGQITVTPSIGSNKTPQTLNVTQGNYYDFETDAGDFRVKVNNIMISGLSKLMFFTTCILTSDVPLAVASLTLNEYDPGQVTANVIIEGTGSGTLQISWGTEETTTHTVSAGGFGYVHAMPAGTHEICAEVIS